MKQDTLARDVEKGRISPEEYEKAKSTSRFILERQTSYNNSARFSAHPYAHKLANLGKGQGYKDAVKLELEGDERIDISALTKVEELEDEAYRVNRAYDTVLNGGIETIDSEARTRRFVRPDGTINENGTRGYHPIVEEQEKFMEVQKAKKILEESGVKIPQ